MRGALDAIVVDDAQELTSAAARLLRVVRAPHIDLLLVGDPDAAVQTFRGADPRLLGIRVDGARRGPDAGAARGAPPARPAAGGQPPGRPGGSVRPARPVTASRPTSRSGGRVDVALLRATSQEAALVAAELRRAHLLDGVPWSQMAVWCAGRGAPARCAGSSMSSGVPVAVSASEVPVRDEMAVRPLLSLLDVVLRAALGDPEPIDPETAVDVVLSPIGGADTVALRRLRRALRREELDGGGGRTSDELLSECLLHPDFYAAVGPEAAPARRVARALAAGVEAARTVRDEGRDGALRWAPGVTAETVLWAMWQAPAWGRRGAAVALGGGLAGARADRDLDAVVALFDAAAALRRPAAADGPRGFLDHIRGQDVAGDTLVARAPSRRRGGAADPSGRSRPRVARSSSSPGVQEGVWPDLRLRGSLLGSERPGRRGDRPGRLGFRGPRRPRSATTRPASSSSRSAGPPSGCS